MLVGTTVRSFVIWHAGQWRLVFALVASGCRRAPSIGERSRPGLVCVRGESGGYVGGGIFKGLLFTITRSAGVLAGPRWLTGQSYAIAD
jgi:hypothetical protein